MLEQRKARLEAILEAVTKHNKLFEHGVSSFALVNKIREDLQVTEKKAKEYVKTLSDTGKIEMRLNGWWSADLKKTRR